MQLFRLVNQQTVLQKSQMKKGFFSAVEVVNIWYLDPWLTADCVSELYFNNYRLNLFGALIACFGLWLLPIWLSSGFVMLL